MFSNYIYLHVRILHQWIEAVLISEGAACTDLILQTVDILGTPYYLANHKYWYNVLMYMYVETRLYVLMYVETRLYVLMYVETRLYVLMYVETRLYVLMYVETRLYGGYKSVVCTMERPSCLVGSTQLSSPAPSPSPCSGSPVESHTQYIHVHLQYTFNLMSMQYCASDIF